jgi:hypothetical protein
MTHRSKKKYWTGGVAQMVQCLPSMDDSQDLIPNTKKKKKERKKKRTPMEITKKS